MTTVNELTELQDGIVKYQVNGDEWIINEIIERSRQDFLANPTRYREMDGSRHGQIHIKLHSNIEYISYRVRSKWEQVIKHYDAAYKDYFGDQFSILISILIIDFNIPLNLSYRKERKVEGRVEWYVFDITTELLDEIDSKRNLINEVVYEVYIEQLAIFMKHYRQRLTEIDKKMEMELPLVYLNIIDSLRHALRYVDASRSDHEIVKYVNLAFSTKFGDLELARKGMRRIQRQNNQGATVLLHVKPFFPDDLTRVLFDTKEYRPERYKATQLAFIEAILKIIATDAKNGDFYGYSTNSRGEARIKRTYIAEKLGITKVNARKKVERILNKCHVF